MAPAGTNDDLRPGFVEPVQFAHDGDHEARASARHDGYRRRIADDDGVRSRIPSVPVIVDGPRLHDGTDGLPLVGGVVDDGIAIETADEAYVRSDERRVGKE